MKDMKLIRRVFAGSLRIRDFLKSILQYLLIFGLLAVISVSLIEPMYKKRKNTEAYEAYRFDVCVGSCTTETYRQIAQSENVSASLGIQLYFEHWPLRRGENQVDCTPGVVLEGSLEPLNQMVIPDELYLFKDDVLMRREDAIVIDYGIYSRLKADLGDTLTWSVSGRDLDYVLAGVFFDSAVESFRSSGNLNAFLPASERYWSLFQNEEFIPSSHVCSYAFFTFRDVEQGRQFIENDFYRDIYLYYRLGEEYKELATEEDWYSVKLHPAGALWREYAAKMTNLAESGAVSASYRKNSLFMIFLLLLAGLILFHNQNRKTELCLRPLAILYAAGLRARALFWYVFLRTGLCYALSEIAFLFLYQTFYRVLKHKYLYTELLLQYGALLVACILLAAAAAGISTVRKLRKSNLSEILAEEERS